MFMNAYIYFGKYRAKQKSSNTLLVRELQCLSLQIIRGRENNLTFHKLFFEAASVPNSTALPQFLHDNSNLLFSSIALKVTPSLQCYKISGTPVLMLFKSKLNSFNPMLSLKSPYRSLSRENHNSRFLHPPLVLENEWIS